MSNSHRATFWAYLAQLGGLPLSAVLLPLVLWRFSLEQLALWYLIQSLGLLASMAEGALEPGLTRYLSYARSGLRTLPTHGEAPGIGQGPADVAGMRELAGAARWLYGRLSWINLFCFGSVGGWVLIWLGASLGDVPQVLTAWGLFCAGQFLACRGFAAISLLQGAGHVDQAFRALAVQRLAFGLTVLVGLACAPRLEMLGLAQIVGAILGFCPALYRARKLMPAASMRPTWERLRALLQGSFALWLSRLGGYLVLRANLPIVSAALGLQAAGRLALAMQLLDAISQLAQAPLLARMPQLYALHVQADRKAFITMVGRVLVVGWVSYAGAALSLAVFGDAVLNWLGKPGVLLSTGLLTLMLAAGGLELNHSMSATLLMVENRVPFVPAALLSGVAIVLLSVLVLTQTQAGLPAAIVIPLLVQAAYNNWRWPLEMLRAFRTRYGELIRAAFSPSR